MESNSYEDDFCKLTTSTLTLKNYFFPTTASKQIPVTSIRRLFYKKQHFPDDAFRSKDWGITLTPIWWGCDLARGMHKSNTNYYNVVVDTGTKMMKGFTVKNINEFLDKMRQLIGEDKFIPNTLPTSCVQQLLLDKGAKQKRTDDRFEELKNIRRESGKSENILKKDISEMNENGNKNEEIESWKSGNEMSEKADELNRERDFDSVSSFSSRKSTISDEKSFVSLKNKEHY